MSARLSNAPALTWLSLCLKNSIQESDAEENQASPQLNMITNSSLNGMRR